MTDAQFTDLMIALNAGFVCVMFGLGYLAACLSWGGTS